MPFTDEKATLLEILQTIYRVLAQVAHEHVREDRELFAETWDKEVGPTLEMLIREIAGIPTEEDGFWRQLRANGFSGLQLKLKAARFWSALKKGSLGKILDIINTILSSIPGADPVREFKEIMEGTVDALDTLMKP